MRLPLEGDAWIKRDDLTGGPYGGNKVRKLEFLLAEARQAGARRLITVGAIGSHHALATTIYGRAAGFEVTAVLLPQPVTPHVGAVLEAMRRHGAEVRLVGSAATVPAGVAAARLAHRRERLRTIAAGGSSPLGTLGYVNAALELADQVEAGAAPRPAVVHVAGGTLGTAVGLAFGFALLGWDTDVVAHRITSRAITNRRRARTLVDGVRRILDPTGAGVPDRNRVLRRFRIEHGQIGRGYGIATDPGSQAMQWFAARALPDLDATYTAKAAAGFLAATGNADGPVLYWHTLSAGEAPESIDPPRGAA
jgi:D-cysteine desulfhydrase